MKSIECINFVSQEAPNILLIADMVNSAQKGYYLKNFKNTHNLYVVYHELNNNFIFYHDLPSKHNFIKQELDKHNLHKFIISTISFGGLLGFYLIFHFPERVEKVFIHDYFYKMDFPISQKSKLDNWSIKKSNIPIVFYLFKGHGNVKVEKYHVIELKNLFNNIRFILINSPHEFVYKLNSFKKNLIFTIFNGFSLNSFWNNLFKDWILNKYKFKKVNHIFLSYFINIYK